MNDGLPQLPLSGTAGAAAMTRRCHTIAAGTLAQGAAAHAIPAGAVLTAALVWVVANWSSQRRFFLAAAGEATLAAELNPGRSFAAFARDIQSQLPTWPDSAGTVSIAGLIHSEITLADGVAVCTWDTADDVLADGVGEAMASACAALVAHLCGGAAAWEQRLPDLLPSVQLAEREQVNATHVPLDPLLLHEMFWQQASRTPDAVAVIDARREVTYRELRTAAVNLARLLSQHGTEPGQLVAVAMHKGWEQTVAVLGILAAGAAYVPVAPDLPEDRLLHLLSHAQASILVTQADIAGALPRTPGVWRAVVTDAILEPDPGAEDPKWAQQPTDLAYVIYTSGSTGLPKGVMIDHQGAVNTIIDINRRFSVGAADRVLALSSLGFDLSVYDIFGLLAVGGAVVFPPPGSERAPWEWAELIDTKRVTVWNTVPALMEMLVTYGEGRGIRLADSLRLVLMSGDWIPVTLPDRIRAIGAPDIRLIGMGGATEASIWSNFFDIGDVDPAWPSIPYGTPLSNQSFEVLDQDLRRRPVWVPGELHIGGMGVAMGYWRDEVKTAASFIHHEGRRLYRTGDLGRYLPGGVLEFLGRQDFQVKIHGFRVELGEIEATLLAHPHVTGAVVTAVDAGHGSKRLAAFVTPQSVNPQSLREYLAAKLPGYMVPDRITSMEVFPLTGNGKVDRTALA